MPSEVDMRNQLGIPPDAEKVIIFTESSHWDPNWLYTSEGYYKKFVQKNLDFVLKELEKEPRRIYSLENVFFLKMYWDRNPEKRDTIRKLVNEKRLRLMSSAVTSADTLLPKTEAILMDFFIGQKWLEENGMKCKPKVAYFPDSFGASPFLPSILNSAGFEMTVITRVDGMYFPGCDFESKRNFPKTGSTAEVFLKKEKTLDFIWKDGRGGEVLAHWNAFTYGQGDMLAYVGISRVYLAKFAIPFRKGRHVARRIHQYVKALEPLSKTPYMLCPIGFDFVEPIPGLVSLLDEYNRTYYPKTGIWAVVAGLDDYLRLVNFYRKDLPTLEIDPNPYWTGFYVSRPEIKRLAHSVVEKVTTAEKILMKEKDESDWEKIRKVWWIIAVSNHHDFITGTATDEVVEKEQIPWLKRAEKEAEMIIKRYDGNDIEFTKRLPEFSESSQRISIKTRFYEIEFDKKSGMITSLKFGGNGEILNGPSNQTAIYRDSGGLWRMGYEFKGGIWKEVREDSVKIERTYLVVHNGAIEIISVLNVLGNTFKRGVWIENDSPVIHFTIEGRLKKGFTLNSRFHFNGKLEKIFMHTPGGIITRPCRKIYEPTYWPLNDFAYFKTPNGYIGILKSFPGAISYDENGKVDISLMRSAKKERVFGVLGLPANPVSLKRTKYETVDYGLIVCNDEDTLKKYIIKHLKEHHLSRYVAEQMSEVENELIKIYPEDVGVISIRKTSEGDGLIVRLYLPFEIRDSIKLKPKFDFKEVFLCDARENDLETLKTSDGVISINSQNSILTVKFILKD